MLTLLIVALIAVPIVWLVIRANNKFWQEHKVRWEPHREAFSGTVVKRYRWSGTTNGLPVTWRLYSVGGGGETGSKQTTYFSIALECPSGGAAWHVHYNIPGLLNRRPEGWTVTTKDPDVERALRQPQIIAELATLPRHFSARYAPKSGRVLCEFAVGGFTYVQPLEEFTRFVAVLQDLSRVAQGARRDAA